MRTNRRNLVRVARAKGHSVASSWQGHLSVGGTVVVFHYQTHMVTVLPDNTVVPVSAGWGSMSDKCGVREVLADVSGESYREVFGV